MHRLMLHLLRLVVGTAKTSHTPQLMLCEVGSAENICPMYIGVMIHT